MKISKKIREEAALICAISASNGSTLYGELGGELGSAEAAIMLAVSAWNRCYASLNPPSAFDVLIDAEAESLLRSGWSPGDES